MASDVSLTGSTSKLSSMAVKRRNSRAIEMGMMAARRGSAHSTKGTCADNGFKANLERNYKSRI